MCFGFRFACACITHTFPLYVIHVAVFPVPPSVFPSSQSSGAAAAASALPMRLVSRATAARESLDCLLAADTHALTNEQSIITDDELRDAGVDPRSVGFASSASASSSSASSYPFTPVRSAAASVSASASASGAAATAAVRRAPVLIARPTQMEQADEDDDEEDEDEDDDEDEFDEDEEDEDESSGGASSSAGRGNGRSWSRAHASDPTANEDFEFGREHGGEDDEDDDEDDDADMEEQMQERARLSTLRRLERDEMEFPDEVETPLDIPARERFARYRGLQNFKTAPWDVYEVRGRTT